MHFAFDGAGDAARFEVEFAHGDALLTVVIEVGLADGLEPLGSFEVLVIPEAGSDVLLALAPLWGSGAAQSSGTNSASNFAGGPTTARGGGGTTCTESGDGP